MTHPKAILAALATLSAAVLIASLANADASKDASKSNQPEMKLPPGWTMDDMKACMAAGTPGKMHEYLTKDAGEWKGKTSMWMGPEGEPITSECTSTVVPIMDGRYSKVEMK